MQFVWHIGCPLTADYPYAPASASPEQRKKPEPPLKSGLVMGLFGRNTTTVGLDIGSGLIKLVQISHASGGPILTKVAFTSVVNDAIVEGEIMDPAIVQEAIKGLMASAGIKSKKVVTAIGGRDVIIKKIAMDRMKETEAREVIRWEAEQHVPFDMDNVELDFQILDPEAEGLQMTVLLVAAKRELVEHKLALLSDVGLEASVIDVDAFALHNAFEINYPEAMRGVVGLVNIGHETSNINILDDGVPVLTRDIPIGTRRFKEDLQRERGLSADQAEAVLKGSESNEALDPLLESRGEELAVGIERAAAFLASSSRSGNQMRAVYTCGGGARVPGLTEALANRLRVRVEQANPLANLKVREGALDSLVTDEVAPLLMLPIGLALRQAA
jgi:type IV pilus assembly protein PilM